MTGISWTIVYAYIYWLPGVLNSIARRIRKNLGYLLSLISKLAKMLDIWFILCNEEDKKDVNRCLVFEEFYQKIPKILIHACIYYTP